MKRNTFGTRKISNSRSSFRRSRIDSSEQKNFVEKIKKIFTKIFSSWFISTKRIFGAFLIIAILGFMIIWGVFLQWLPDIKKIESWEYYRESTTYYDNDDKEMYSVSENWKRTYVYYEYISDSIKDAIVATEDSGFWENPGVDVFGLFRAGINYALGNTSSVKWTSTLSQQLVKNTLLTNERSMKRKIQEAYLAYRLNQEYSKQKILEMYLNAIEFGHWANWIEQASLTFFGKSAKDVGPLGAVILASLPKWPTQYSPYSNRGNLMWKIEAYPSNSPKNRVLLSLDVANWEYASLYSEFKNYIKNINFERKWNNWVKICGLKKEYSWNPNYTPNNNGCLEVGFSEILDVIGWIEVVWNLSINWQQSEQYTIEYTIGRKDYVAIQMFKENKIKWETLSSIIYDWLEFQFKKLSQSMKYPYFVMYVREELEKKYWKDININEWLKVYTTIRPTLQDKAEEIIKEQVASNKKSHWANSASLIAMDNTTGEIIAMVGWPDYFDEENGGNNNMTTAKRQPGSSFKPLIYGLAISKWAIWPESPVADVETEFGTYKPNNYDEKFEWIMSLGKALAYSRNIPAVKMYFLAGNEKSILPFVKTLWIDTIKPWEYWASLALGAGEVRAIDMMQAYSVFANNGIKKEIYAIKKIEDSQWWIIEEHKKTDWQEVFSPEASYIVNKILSENENRPSSEYWRNALTIKWHTVAAKTWTANKPAKKWTNKILPWDTWTIWYSPNITTVVWAGNVDGSALGGKCDGINCAAPAWNKFMTFALKDYPKVDFKEPKWLLTYKTAKMSGLLSDSGVTNIMAVELKEKDNGTKELKIDSLCNGIATDRTPEDSIIIAQVPNSKPIIDGYDPEWLKWFYARANISAVEWLWKTSNKECERPANNGNVTISFANTGINNNILEITWGWNRMIEKIKILSNNTITTEEKFEEAKTIWSYRINLNQIPTWSIVELIDVYGYKYSEKIQQNQTTETPTTVEQPILPSMREEIISNTPAPSITISNPTRQSINIYSGNMFNLRFNVIAGTIARDVIVTIDWNIIEKSSAWDNFVIPIYTENLNIGDHIVNISVTDWNSKTSNKSFTLTILEK